MIGHERTLYVAGLLFSDRHVALIRKQRPDWQRAKLNGVGGHVELGESSADAMEREWREETQSALTPKWDFFCELAGKAKHEQESDWVVAWYRAEVGAYINTDVPLYDPPNTPGAETVDWYPVDALPVNVMPNIPWLVAMATGSPLARLDWPLLVVEQGDPAKPRMLDLL